MAPSILLTRHDYCRVLPFHIERIRHPFALNRWNEASAWPRMEMLAQGTEISQECFGAVALIAALSELPAALDTVAAHVASSGRASLLSS